MSSKSLPFRHLWAPNPPKVHPMRPPENRRQSAPLKIHEPSQNELQNGLLSNVVLTPFGLPVLDLHAPAQVLEKMAAPGIKNAYGNLILHPFLFFWQRTFCMACLKVRLFGVRRWHAAGVFDKPLPTPSKSDDFAQS